MNRLRKLDALFAERVLDMTIHDEHKHIDCYDDGPPVVRGKSVDGQFGCEYGSVKRYTRSLDAIYEATNSGPFCCRRIESDHNIVHDVRVSKDDEVHAAYYGQAGHPAEALVLAMLRAVGVTEDKITACDVD